MSPKQPNRNLTRGELRRFRAEMSSIRGPADLTDELEHPDAPREDYSQLNSRKTRKAFRSLNPDAKKNTPKYFQLGMVGVGLVVAASGILLAMARSYNQSSDPSTVVTNAGPESDMNPTTVSFIRNALAACKFQDGTTNKINLGRDVLDTNLDQLAIDFDTNVDIGSLTGCDPRSIGALLLEANPKVLDYNAGNNALHFIGQQTAIEVPYASGPVTVTAMAPSNNF